VWFYLALSVHSDRCQRTKRPTVARDFAFPADGHRLYFSVGSVFDPYDAHTSIVVTAQRDCEGMTIQPATGELGCIENEHGKLGGKCAALGIAAEGGAEHQMPRGG
jgi:hypothetical protein